MKSKAKIIILISIISISISCASLKKPGESNRNMQHSSQFTIKKLVIAENIEGREPIGVSDIFPATIEKVYCFLEATKIKKDTQIKFIWYRDSKKVHTYKALLKQGDRWRTYAYKNVYGKRGKWNVKIKDSADNIIKTVSFTVE